MLVIIIFSLFLGRSHNVVIGIYIGFVTNALVSMFILNVAIPELQARIASTIGSNMSNFVDTDSSDEAGAGVGVGLGTILGLFLPGGIATTALTGLLGMLGGHKAGEKVGEMAGERIKKGVEENIRSGVENLSPKEMCDFIDSIIGAILIAIEVLGAFFGVLFVWLF